MGSRKRYDQLMEQMRLMYQQAQQPSPYVQQVQTEYNNLGNWLNAKDYRNMPAGVNVDLLPLAEYQRMQQMMRGNNNGQAAKGANTTALQRQQREVGDNDLVQNWAGAYENKVGELMGRKDALLNMLQGDYTNRMQTGVQGSQAMLQAFQNRPKSWFSSLLPSMIQGGAQVGAAFI